MVYGFDRVVKHQEPDGVIYSVEVPDELVPVLMAWKDLCNRLGW
jgi:hypothetical protein